MIYKALVRRYQGKAARESGFDTRFVPNRADSRKARKSQRATKRELGWPTPKTGQPEWFINLDFSDEAKKKRRGK